MRECPDCVGGWKLANYERNPGAIPYVSEGLRPCGRCHGTSSIRL